MMKLISSSDTPDSRNEHPAKSSDYPLKFDADFWDDFLPDEGSELEPLPEPGDFWIDPEMEDYLPRFDSITSQLNKEISYVAVGQS